MEGAMGESGDVRRGFEDDAVDRVREGDERMAFAAPGDIGGGAERVGVVIFESLDAAFGPVAAAAEVEAAFGGGSNGWRGGGIEEVVEAGEIAGAGVEAGGVANGDVAAQAAEAVTADDGSAGDAAFRGIGGDGVAGADEAAIVVTGDHAGCPRRRGGGAGSSLGVPARAFSASREGDVAREPGTTRESGVAAVRSSSRAWVGVRERALPFWRRMIQKAASFQASALALAKATQPAASLASLT